VKVVKPAGEVAAGIAGFELPPAKPPAKIIEGDVAKATAELVRLLRDEAKVL